MTERQFEGRSTAEAAIKACEALGVTRSALRYRVVSETGELLQRRVVIAIEGVEAATSSTDAPSRDTDNSADASESYGNREPRGERREAEGGRGRRGRGGSGGRTRERSERGGRDRDRDRSRRGGGRSGPRERGDREGGRSPRDDDGIEALLKLDARPNDAPARPAIEPKSPRAQRALTVVSDMVRLLKLDLRANVVAEEEVEIHIDLVGGDETRIIGRKGEVLLALQFVLNRIISRGEDDGGQVAVLDAGAYRQRRRGALEELARRLAQRAVEERKAVRLSPMSAHDRRVFHMTLKELEGVTTRSEGDGVYRNLLIIPAEFA